MGLGGEIIWALVELASGVSAAARLGSVLLPSSFRPHSCRLPLCDHAKTLRCTLIRWR